MKRVRDLLMIVATVVLGGGYLLSQWSAATGKASAVAAQFDQMPIRLLSLVLVVATFVAAFWPDPKEPA
jgi:hypothetical protein